MHQLLTRYGFHFTSLISVVVLMVWGFSATYAVFWSILLAILVSYLRADTALWPDRLFRALADGSIQALGVAATCACAGLIVGVITKTGLALKFSSIVIDLAGGSVFWTAMYTALIVWVVGLAVPVTASYIMCAVIAAPALIKLGIPDYAAHMFIFYYAVLSEVSPPTALAPFAAATITRADPYVTTLQSWKYALPAFLVPFIFVLDPIGIGLLLETPKGMGWGSDPVGDAGCGGRHRGARRGGAGPSVAAPRRRHARRLRSGRHRAHLPGSHRRLGRRARRRAHDRTSRPRGRPVLRISPAPEPGSRLTRGRYWKITRASRPSIWGMLCGSSGLISTSTRRALDSPKSASDRLVRFTVSGVRVIVPTWTVRLPWKVNSTLPPGLMVRR